jgi:trehalose 6-phosphate synthase
VPSRTDVEKYRLLKDEVERLVGNINGKYGSLGKPPIIYLYKSVGFAELTALYRIRYIHNN